VEAVLNSSSKAFTLLFIAVLESIIPQTYSTNIAGIRIQFAIMGFRGSQQVFGIQELYRLDHEPAEIK
jgi:hypothetical protein